MKKDEIVIVNETQYELSQYGYNLSNEDIQELIRTQKVASEASDMIDMDHHIIFVLASTFARSPYILIATYVELVKQSLVAYYMVRRHVASLYDDEIVALLYEEYLLFHGIFSKECILACIRKGNGQ